MSNVNADATQLLTILKNMRTSISSIETILDTKFIISQIGKQCKPVQVHSFSRISLWVILRKFACWGSIPNPL